MTFATHRAPFVHIEAAPLRINYQVCGECCLLIRVDCVACYMMVTLAKLQV